MRRLGQMLFVLWLIAQLAGCERDIRSDCGVMRTQSPDGGSTDSKSLATKGTNDSPNSVSPSPLAPAGQITPLKNMAGYF